MTTQLAASPGTDSYTAPPPRGPTEQAKRARRTLTWLIRGIASALIGVVTFGYSAASGRDLVIEAIAFAIGAVVVAYWLVADLRPELRQPRALAGAPGGGGGAIGF